MRELCINVENREAMSTEGYALLKDRVLINRVAGIIEGKGQTPCYLRLFATVTPNDNKPDATVLAFHLVNNCELWLKRYDWNPRVISVLGKLDGVDGEIVPAGTPILNEEINDENCPRIKNEVEYIVDQIEIRIDKKCGHVYKVTSEGIN
jgi:hypothetical protein